MFMPYFLTREGLGYGGEDMHEYGVSLFGILYLLIGVVVALTNGYAIHTIGELLSFVLAILLWPLVLLNVNLHVAV
jgi:hypothetical protein